MMEDTQRTQRDGGRGAPEQPIQIHQESLQGTYWNENNRSSRKISAFH